MKRIGPNPGQQTKFLSTPADIAIYGGAAGGGKSFGLLMDPLRFVHVPGFSAVLFRKTYGDIKNPGGLWDASYDLYPYVRGYPRETSLSWEWSSGARVQMSHFQHRKYMANWQGAQVPLIGWDELTHFSYDVFMYMLSRNRSMCGIRPYIRGTCNPDPDHWLRDFLRWWIDDETGLPIPERDGVLRWMIRTGGKIEWFSDRLDIPKRSRQYAKSVTFISAKLADNPQLAAKDPMYIANLMALRPHEREQLLGGNWNVRLVEGMYFKRHFFQIIDRDEVPQRGVVGRGWDRAATEVSESNPDPDYTAGVRMRIADGNIYIEDVIHERWTPEKVERNILMAANADGRGCSIALEQDPGSAGKSEVAHLMKMLHGFDVHAHPTTQKKEIRARALSAQAEAGNVYLVRGDWNEAFIRELESFPSEQTHDDQVDAASVIYNHLTLASRRPGVRFLSM